MALFVTILKLKDPEASVFGARALARLGKQAKSALPELMQAVKGSDPSMQRTAIDTVAAIGADPKIAMPLYISALKDSTDSGVRQSTLHAIGELGNELSQDKTKLTKDGAAKEGIAKDAVNAVLDATKDSDAQVKKAAFSAAAKLGALIGTAGAKQIMPSVIDGLQSKEASGRDQAYETVAGLGPLARDAVPVLITIMDKQEVKLYRDSRTKRVFLNESDDAFLDKIAKTIGKVGHPAVKPLLASLNTTNLNWGLAIGICRSLGEVGPAAGRTAITQLRYISQGNNPPPVCLEADRALRKIQSK